MLAVTAWGADRLEGYESIAGVKQRLAALPLHPVEGLWRFPDDGGVVAIERDVTLPGDHYVMVAVKPQNRAIRPGTVMGHLTATSQRGKYDARLFTKKPTPLADLTGPKKFLITLADNDTRLTIQPYGKKYEFRWWYLFPYMYRRVIRRTDSTPSDLDGCTRLYPAPLPPTTPIYL